MRLGKTSSAQIGSNSFKKASESPSYAAPKKTLPVVPASSRKKENYFFGNSGKSRESKFPGSSGLGIAYGSTKPKSSTSFGIIWLPIKKKNPQKKDKVHDAYIDDYKTKKNPHNYFANAADEHGAGSSKHHGSSETNSLAEETQSPYRALLNPPTVITFVDDPDEKEDGPVESDPAAENRDAEAAAENATVKQSLKDDNPDGVYMKKDKPGEQPARAPRTQEGRCEKCLLDCLGLCEMCCGCGIM